MSEGTPGAAETDQVAGAETTPGTLPQWSLRLKVLCVQIQSASIPGARDEVVSEAWLLLNAALNRYLRAHAARLGRLAREELEDIAAQKALDLLRRIGAGRWDVSGREPLELAGYLSTVARNALRDRLHDVRRRVVPEDERRPEWQVGAGAAGGEMSERYAPDKALERKEFAHALLACLQPLKPRSRLIWFFRVFYAMSSKEIAAHPRIHIKPSHVDVLLQRARAAIRDCLHRRGYESLDMPAGTAVLLWEALGLEGA